MTSGAQATSLSDIVLVSVGTGEQPSMPYDANVMAGAGLVGWAQHISDVMFESQSAIADFQAGLLLPNAYLKINPKLGNALPLDDIDHLNDLKNLADLGRSHEILIKKFFLEA